MFYFLLQIILFFLIIPLHYSIFASPISSNSNHMHNHKESIVIEGDLILSESHEFEDLKRGQRSAIIGQRHRWLNAIVPYEFLQLNQNEMKLVKGSMKEIENKSCVRFKQRFNEPDFVRIRPGKGCNSHVGRIGGSQDLNLERSHCMNHGTILHELVHALGFYHEHSRTDRDNYINIMWPNIFPNNRYDFETKRSLNLVPYDFDSILHYNSYEFSISGRPSIVPKNSNIKIGQRKHLSQLDIVKINKMYCSTSTVNHLKKN